MVSCTNLPAGRYFFIVIRFAYHPVTWALSRRLFLRILLLELGIYCARRDGKWLALSIHLGNGPEVRTSGSPGEAAHADEDGFSRRRVTLDLGRADYDF